MLRPGDTLFVYGVAAGAAGEGRLPAREHLAGILEEEDSAYLVYTRDVGAELSAANVEIAYEASLPYEQWLDGDALEPVELGGVTVVPPWCDAPTGEGRPVLLMEPSLVFGTGAHPTTRRSAALVEELLSHGPPPETVLDLGCGTGLLSLIALTHGAGRALGCDTSALAVEVARRNASRNDLGHRASFERGSAGELVAPAELLLGNLPPFARGELLAHPALRSCRAAVLSGMLPSHAEELAQAPPDGVDVVEIFADGHWRTALLRPRAAAL